MEFSDNYISCERGERKKFLLEDARDSGRDKGKKVKGMIFTSAKITSAYLKRSLIDSREGGREGEGKIWKMKEGR